MDFDLVARLNEEIIKTAGREWMERGIKRKKAKRTPLPVVGWMPARVDLVGLGATGSDLIELWVCLLAALFAGDMAVGKHLLNLMESNQDSDVQASAVKTLAQHWKEQYGTREWLEMIARKSESPAVRGAALEELFRHFREHPQTLAFLKIRVCEERDSAVQYTALSLIGSTWKETQDYLDWLDEDWEKILGNAGAFWIRQAVNLWLNEGRTPSR